MRDTSLAPRIGQIPERVVLKGHIMTTYLQDTMMCDKYIGQVIKLTTAVSSISSTMNHHMGDISPCPQICLSHQIESISFIIFACYIFCLGEKVDELTIYDIFDNSGLIQSGLYIVLSSQLIDSTCAMSSLSILLG